MCKARLALRERRKTTGPPTDTLTAQDVEIERLKSANQTLLDSNASLNSRVAELEDLVDKGRSDAADECADALADALKKRDMAWETHVVDFESQSKVFARGAGMMAAWAPATRPPPLTATLAVATRPDDAA